LKKKKATTEPGKSQNKSAMGLCASLFIGGGFVAKQQQQLTVMAPGPGDNESLIRPANTFRTHLSNWTVNSKQHKPVKYEKTDIFRGFILKCHIVRNHNGSVKGKT